MNIQKRFEEIQNKNPYWSSIVCFNNLVASYKKLSPLTINHWFRKLVDKDDYEKNEKSELLEYSLFLSSA